jgi:hypothetical protein
MPSTSTTFDYTDPRGLDGDPFQVAAVACHQAEKVLGVAEKAVDDAYVMARGAHMERQLQTEDEPDGVGFANDPLGARILSIRDRTQDMAKAIKNVAVAASYNPRKPPKELPA